MTADTTDIAATALDWHAQGRAIALAWVVETWGSAPRPVGSLLVVSDAGQMAGSVSGGCVEGAVVVEAIEALEDGAPRILDYGVSDDEAFAVGLACGGRIRVLVEPVLAQSAQNPNTHNTSALSPDLLADLVAARRERRAVAYVVDTDTWQRQLAPPETFPERFRADQSGFEDTRFVAIQNPPLKLIVVGAVHIAQPLVGMAHLAGYDPTVVDPRDAFGSAARFPGEAIVNDWPDAALSALGIDARTAVVTLTHDPKLDDPALMIALQSPAFYVGSLGSTRTHAKRVTRLTEAGLSADQLARLHAPVGLNIGARTPAEIAIAVLAQITQSLRQG